MIEQPFGIDLDNPKINLIEHDSAESIFDEFWNFEKDLSFKELLRCEIGEALEGEDVTPVILADAFESVRDMKFWAFAKVREKEVHIWLGKKMKREELQLIIGHKIGNILEDEVLASEQCLVSHSRIKKSIDNQFYIN